MARRNDGTLNLVAFCLFIIFAVLMVILKPAEKECAVWENRSFCWYTSIFEYGPIREVCRVDRVCKERLP